jgi:hypothetical protein
VQDFGVCVWGLRLGFRVQSLEFEVKGVET